MKQFDESRMAHNTEADSTMARANASTGAAHSDVPQHDARPTVLAFGTYNARKHPRVGILIDGLRKNGCIVEEVNHPLRLSTAQRVEILQRPWKLFGFAWNLLRLWLSLRKDARAWVRANGRPAAVLVGYMGHFDVLLAHHLFAGVPIILDHLIFAGDTAQDRGAHGLKVRLLQRLDRWAINAATLVLVDTEEHGRMLKPSDASMVVPVGAPEQWYEASQHEAAQQREAVEAIKAAEARKSLPDIVFYGLYTPLQGTPIIAQALQRLADRGLRPHVTMIGNGQEYQEVRRLTKQLGNIEYRSWVEPEQLPALVATHDIALGIFSTTPKGLRVVPNKVYQSMAAGCAVITSGTAPQRRMLGDGVVYVAAGDADALADALERLLRQPEALEHARLHAAAAARRFTDVTVARPLYEWIAAVPNGNIAGIEEAGNTDAADDSSDAENTADAARPQMRTA